MPASLRPVVSACLAVLTLSLLPSTGFGQQLWALRGVVVAPEGPIPGATVLIDGNTIRAVGRDLPLPGGTRVVETNGTIYPGLIDLHNHVTWNVFPHWNSSTRFGARYDWQQIPEYHMALSLPHEKLIAEGHGCAAERYAEVKALVGGATAQAGLSTEELTLPGSSAPAQVSSPQCLGGHVRELGVNSLLGPAGTAESLRYEIFPLALDAPHTTGLLQAMQQHTVQAVLAHVGEGSATDASARREFSFFESHGMLVPGVSIIHGVALTPANFKEMARQSVGLIWSPRSNLELYGSTSDVASAKLAGVTLSLAPDWSPTGSEGMLQELKYAAVWNATQNPSPFTDHDLFLMATQNPATLAGMAAQTGSIAAGKRADLLVLSSPQGDPYNALVHASPDQVALVVVEGVAQYGDRALMQKARPNGASSPLTICGSVKELATPTPGAWAATESELNTALVRWGAPLPPLSNCR